MPALDIPEFDGRIESWPAFYESFRVNIHENPDLTDAERVNYLMAKLTHSGRKAVSGVIPNGDAYRSIWDNLLEKYQDRCCWGTYYIDNLFNLPSCTYFTKSTDAFVESFAAATTAIKNT